MAKRRSGQHPRELPLWRQRWRWFWARRSGARTVAALALALLALLAAIYLALPTHAQQTVTQTLTTTAQALGATGLGVALECALLGCALGSVALLFAPGARYRRYFTLPSAEVARVAVYLDAENVNEQRHIQAIVRRLRAEYAGQPLELLFFAQLNDSLRGAGYRDLYLHGFRPIHVPHDPTGTNKIEEAVDKELAMHALQRALMGPAHQTFILIAKDGGYVPLIYRLTALGHAVEVWSPDPINAYHIAQSYLHITVIDLSKLASASADGRGTEGAAGKRLGKRPAMTSKAKASGGATGALAVAADATPSLALPDPPSATFAHEGERQLYVAIYQTCALCKALERRKGDAPPAWEKLRAAVRARLTPTLAGLGYSSYSGSAYWIQRLRAIGALASAEDGSPTVGPVAPQLAAQRLFAMTLASARAATLAQSTRSDKALNMQVICAALFAQTATSADLEPLRTLLASTLEFRFAHTRFFVSSARALGLLDYTDAQKSRDLILAPRLTSLAERLIAQQAQPLTPTTPEQG